MSLYGFGNNMEPDVSSALKYFEAIPDSSKSNNARGAIYYMAPDVFETDPYVLRGWGSIRKDTKKARKHLEIAAEKGNLHARYNLGLLHLDDKDEKNFSFSKAYD